MIKFLAFATILIAVIVYFTSGDDSTQVERQALAEELAKEIEKDPELVERIAEKRPAKPVAAPEKAFTQTTSPDSEDPAIKEPDQVFADVEARYAAAEDDHARHVLINAIYESAMEDTELVERAKLFLKEKIESAAPIESNEPFTAPEFTAAKNFLKLENDPAIRRSFIENFLQKNTHPDLKIELERIDSSLPR